jgi:drug/metabolite transporter (DMT)-like permease
MNGPSRAAAMLVVVTLLWGLSFPWMKEMQDDAGDCPGGKALASLTLIAIRMPLAVLVLAAWQPRLFSVPTRREHACGLLIGAAFFAGFVLQVWGLAYTTPALSAFFTSLGSAWVPLLAWACLGERVGRLPLLGLTVALLGTAVLVDGGWRLGPGEGLTFLASVIYAGEILLLDRLGKRVRSEHLSAGFFGASAVLGVVCVLALAAAGPGLGTWLAWTADYLTRRRVQVNLACLTLLSTVIAFHWMNLYQPRVSSSRAALIYLLEPVFGSIFSVWHQHDPLTARLALGGGLILAGNLIVEAPGWVARKDEAECCATDSQP